MRLDLGSVRGAATRNAMRAVLVAIAVLLLVATFWIAVPRARAGQVACAGVMREVNGRISREKGRAADLSDIAKRLGTSVPWVERCMRTYGRRPKRPSLESAEGREAVLEDYEENEPEESAREDVEEPGARERPEHPEHARYSQFKFTPTPELGIRERLPGLD